HAQQLDRGTATLLTGRRERELQVQPDAARSTWRLVPVDGRPIPPGRHSIRLAWRGQVQATDSGLFVVEHGGGAAPSRMLATQLQAVFARMVMPVMDEPVFRTVFEVSVRAPQGLDVVSNMPRVAQRDSPAGGRSWTLHRFAPTPPMPSYLVALAVGRFDRVEGRAGKVPVAILTAPGKGPQAAYALEATQQLLPWLADYFGQPYRLPKLDQLAVPGVRDGAMEDWGLISYYETLLLWDPRRSTPAAQRAVFSIMAHEIAHQWFGNLVSPSGWNEIWLNEAFATWLERKATHHFNPAWNTPLSVRRDIERVMQRDAGPASRAIRGAPLAESRVFDVFDNVTYDKGGSVLSMVEQWVGEPRLRRGLRAYMAERQMKPATAGDLWHHIGRAAGRDVGAMARGWTDQTGLPLVSVATRCEDGQLRIDLAQQRFSEAPLAPQRWPIPVQLARGPALRTVMLDGPTASLRWGPCDGAPVRANAGAAGYYRVAYDEGSRQALAPTFAALPAPDQLALLSDSFALAGVARQDLAGHLPWWAALPAPRDAGAAMLWITALDQVDEIGKMLAGAAPEAELRRVHQDLLRQALQAVGWDGPADEPAELQGLRRRAIAELARTGDAPTRAEAERRFEAAMDLTSGMPGALRRTVLAAAGPAADAARVERLLAAMSAAGREDDRWLYFQALAQVGEPALIEALLDAAVNGRLPRTQAGALPGALSWNAQRGAQVFAHLLRHWPAWKALVGDGLFGALPWLLPKAAWHSVDADMPQRLAAAQRQHLGEAGDTPVAQAVAAIDARSRWRAREVETLGPALQGWRRAAP
ncbi:MAG: M1 family metallopeptidase, partial [Aquabacterium sp.]